METPFKFKIGDKVIVTYDGKQFNGEVKSININPQKEVRYEVEDENKKRNFYYSYSLHLIQ